MTMKDGNEMKVNLFLKICGTFSFDMENLLRKQQCQRWISSNFIKFYWKIYYPFMADEMMLLVMCVRLSVTQSMSLMWVREYHTHIYVPTTPDANDINIQHFSWCECHSFGVSAYYKKCKKNIRKSKFCWKWKWIFFLIFPFPHQNV